METSTANNFVFPIYSEKEFIGNGFIIRKGYALTADHVVLKGGRRALNGGTHYTFDIIKSFSAKFREGYLNDFALIYSNSFDLEVFPVINPEILTLNEELSVLAYTLKNGQIYLDSYDGLYQELHAEYITGNVRKKYLNTKEIKYPNVKNAKAPFYGNSGAPVLNKQGEIVGLFYGMYGTREYQARNGNTVYKNAGYFIEASYIISKLQEFL